MNLWPEYYRDGWVVEHYHCGPAWTIPPVWLDWLLCLISPKYRSFVRAMREME